MLSAALALGVWLWAQAPQDAAKAAPQDTDAQSRITLDVTRVGVLYTVTDIYPDHVVLDGNHPLAGIAIRLTMKVESVREATEDEIGRGTAGTGFFKVQVMVAGNDTLH